MVPTNEIITDRAVGAKESWPQNVHIDDMWTILSLRQTKTMQTQEKLLSPLNDLEKSELGSFPE